MLLATSDAPDRRDASDAEASEPDAPAPEPPADPPEPGDLGPSVLPQESAAEHLGPEPPNDDPQSLPDAAPEAVSITPEAIPPPPESLTSTPLDDEEASDLGDAEVSPHDESLELLAATESGVVQPVEQAPPVAAEPTRAEPPVAPAETRPRDEPGREKRSSLQRVVLSILVIAAAALIGYVLSRPSDQASDADALARSIDAAGRLQLRLETDTPAEARSYIREEFGWRVGVPVFEAIPLRGVAIALTAPAVEVPVFLYADVEDRNVAVFAYSYALLDQVPDRLRLTATDYDELDRGRPFVRRADGNDVVVWRDRDDIYIAVTDLPPDALTDGLAMAR